MTKKTPLWHLATLVVVLLGMSAAASQGDDWRPEGHAPHAVVLIYLGVTLLEWVVAAFVLWQWPWRPAEGWRQLRPLAINLATAALMSLVMLAVANGLVALLGPEKWGSPTGLLPRGGIEIAFWIVLSISAGICEEIIYRGYLLQQLALRSGSTSLAIIGQAVLFGASHGYQSVKSMVMIIIWGVIYGLVVVWRKSLAPGMIAHAGLDIAGILIK